MLSRHIYFFVFANFCTESMGWSKFGTQIAECEWTSVLSIILYNLSYTYEFKGELNLQVFLKNEEDDDLSEGIMSAHHLNNLFLTIALYRSST